MKEIKFQAGMSSNIATQNARQPFTALVTAMIVHTNLRLLTDREISSSLKKLLKAMPALT
jgi:hypothetical protein